MNHYDNFKIRITVKNSPLNLHTIEKGITTSSMISVILFNFAMNLTVKSTEKQEIRNP